MAENEEKNWKHELVDFMEEMIEQEKKIIKKQPGSRGESLANIISAIGIIEYVLTHDLGERPICSNCGMAQQNHMTHCPHHK